MEFGDSNVHYCGFYCKAWNDFIANSVSEIALISCSFFIDCDVVSVLVSWRVVDLVVSGYLRPFISLFGFAHAVWSVSV